MARATLTLIAALWLAVAGCDKPKATWNYPTPPATTRPSAIPLPDVLTPATQADIAAAADAASDPAIAKALTDYMGPEAPRWRVAAARDMGEYVLLWIGFHGVADGAIDLVYSKPDWRVNWHFTGSHPGG